MYTHICDKLKTNYFDVNCQWSQQPQRYMIGINGYHCSRQMNMSVHRELTLPECQTFRPIPTLLTFPSLSADHVLSISLKEASKLLPALHAHTRVDSSHPSLPLCLCERLCCQAPGIHLPHLHGNSHPPYSPPCYKPDCLPPAYSIKPRKTCLCLLGKKAKPK